MGEVTSIWLWLIPVFVIGIAVQLLRNRSAAKQAARVLGLREIYRAAKDSGNPRLIKAAAVDLLSAVSTSSRYGREVEEIYLDVLAMLKADPSLKPFALELGRVAYGSKREDRLPTTYDEQAILNDINVHT